MSAFSLSFLSWIIRALNCKSIDNGLLFVPLLQMENPNMETLGDPSFKGLVMTSEHPPMWTGLHPSFFPGYEVKILNLITPRWNIFVFNFPLIFCSSFFVCAYLITTDAN